MLSVEFVNDRSGSNGAANYIVRVTVNHRIVAHATVKGHNREDHWTTLLRLCAEQNGTPPPTTPEAH